MKKIFNLILVGVILFSGFQLCANAHHEDNSGIRDVQDLTKDCKALYVLTKDTVQKFSVPNLTLVKSVNLPSHTRGKKITLAGACGDPTETVLVSANGKGSVLLSYNEDLQLIAQLNINERDDDDD